MGQGLLPKERSPLGKFAVGPIKCQSTPFCELRNLEKEKTACLLFSWDSLDKDPRLVNEVMNQHVTPAYLQN